MRGLFFSALFVATVAGGWAAEADAAYANDPYWYRPGHAVNPAEATAIRTRPGFLAEKFVTVPQELGSWTALCIDPRGRLIAAAQDQPGLFRIAPPESGEGAPKIERLGGVADQVGWSQGLLYAFDSLYVTVAEANNVATRGVYRLQDTDDDDQFDRATLLFALDGAGEHGPHNLVVDPDLKSVYVICGNNTKTLDGFVRRRPVATKGVDHLMPPGFPSSEYSTQGWVMRFDPDGGNRELICTGLRNAYDLAFNQAGDLFTFDSDDEWDLGTPWYRPTRIVQLVSGGEYGWRQGGAAWPEHYEDSVGPVLNVGPSSPTGIVFGYGARFPAKYQRALFVCDWTFATIHAVFLEPNGAGYRAEIEEFLGGTGLPVTDIAIGADGAMYVVVGGRRLGSAIYRVSYAGTEDTATAAVEPERPALQQVRRRLEEYHGRVRSRAVEAAWARLGDSDRAIRFAARLAVEAQPVDTWREKALAEKEPVARLTALLALVRQGLADDRVAVMRACEAWPWAEASTETRLNVLRLAELALAHGVQPGEAWRTTLIGAFPDRDPVVTREMARLLGRAGDARLIDPALTLMAADTGQRPAQGLGYFTRNAKYGQALRDMLAAPPLLERMHHAQMLLWLAEKWTPKQRRRYFELVADAMAHSRGGHQYRDFWSRVRDTALERMPEAERAELGKIGAEMRTSAETVEPVKAPRGPGREWTVAAVAELVASGLTGRDFANGKAMFTATGCAACHRVGGTGGAAGPDLSSLGQRFTSRDVAEAIVDPNRAVSDQYLVHTVQTTDGRSVSGRLISRDGRVTHLAPNPMRPSQTIVVPNDTIARMDVLPTSLMPPGLLNALNEDEVRDLLAFILSGGDARHPAFAGGADR